MDSFPKLLLVDDEEPFRNTLAKRLKETGYEVAEAGSGLDALETLSEGAIDVVVLDIQMPGMSGLETLSEIRGRHIGTEVIMLTGHGDVSSAVEGMRLGAYDYLMKPCEYEYLVVKIQEAFKVKKERDERLRKAEERSLLDRMEKQIRF
ncbi:MAG: response regulator [Desulfomicrobium sp.]|nr:response regulator [Pseudomonadota bacterium]MBV1710868.1 response regulator [Desulfomicrobium sp.]MBU4571495.1 response regulator [Pseudomonadota bacterium]MBU4594483.1 response regulator [Pseudomonadota bacterium]MBV1720196.1 response regulator [Desulfomicrobium sp.]